jgi:hypothetical protein
VKGILDLHKGAISVFSAGEGFGTCFTFEVPMLRHPYSELNESSMRINMTRRESEKKKQRSDVCRDYEFCDLIGKYIHMYIYLFIHKYIYIYVFIYTYIYRRRGGGYQS